jgi:hypothetical protein
MSVLGSDAKADFFLDSYPSIPLDVKVAAQFHCKPPRFNNSVEPPYPLIKAVKAAAGVPLPVPAMSEKLLPPGFVHDLYASPHLHFTAIFGAAENDYIPTFSIEDFWPIRDSPFTWPSLAAILLKKYKGLLSLGGDRSQVYNRFVNRLTKNCTSKDARVLIYGAGWGIQGIPLAQRLIPTSPCSFYTLSMAHPLTTRENVASLNPALTGSVSETFTEERFFYTSQVGLGERDLLGEVNFDFHHNRVSFIVSRVRLRSAGRPREEMFHPLVHVDPIHYALPEVKETGSEVDDTSFVLASFLRGEKVYENLAKHSIFHRRLPDVGNVWNNFEIFQLYSPYSKISADSIIQAIGSQPDIVKYHSLGKGLCDAVVAVTPPHPANSLRIVKIGSVKEISALKYRATPIATCKGCTWWTRSSP